MITGPLSDASDDDDDDDDRDKKVTHLIHFSPCNV